MNGRVYDYNLGRFLSVDPFIQEPGNSQSMNPYSYIMNNPLAGTDPSGYIIETPWDVGSVVYDLGKIAYGYATDNDDMVSEGLVDLAVDAASVLVPGLPAGSSKVARGVSEGFEQAATKMRKGSKGKGAEDVPTKSKTPDKSGSNGKTEGQGTKANTNQKTEDIGSQTSKNKPCSFVAGTLVSTPNGFIEIQELAANDMVWAKDDETDEVDKKKVNGVFDEVHEEVIELTIQLSDGKKEVITTTAEHPFMVYDGDWLPAGELEVGSFVETLSGHRAEVIGFEVIKEQQVAYNFEVDDYHTYSVGKGMFWVHNACKKEKRKGKKARDSSKNEPHANQDKKGAAASKYEIAKRYNDHMKQLPKKTKESKKLQKKAQKAEDKYRKEKEYKGDNDSRRGRGGN